MIELRRIRTFTPAGQDTPEAYDRGFEPAILFNDINDFITKHETVINSVPEKERFNLYVTCNQVKQGVTKRKESWKQQDLIMWDIDDVSEDDKTKSEIYLKIISEVLKVKSSDLVFIQTGGGFHVVMQIKTPITTKTWFSKYALEYQVLCSQIDDRLKDAGLTGALDTQVFAPNRMFRAPLSLSKKAGRDSRTVTMLPVDKINPVDWDIKKATGLPELEDKDYMSKKELSYIKVDSGTVETACEFLKFAKSQQASVSEGQWYAMLSIVARLKNGKELVHDYSKLHPSYSPTKTNRKTEQALKSSGPRTCDNIDKLWGACNKCPHYKKVRSPISLKGPDFIATAHSGFHTITPKGTLVPQYDDLRKYYDAKMPYLNAAGSHYRFEETQWKEYADVYIENYAESKFVPAPKNVMCSEFRGKVKRTKLKDPQWFGESTDRRLNFQNGVLNIDTMELEDHSPKYGFKDTLGFDWDPEAEAPEFKKMLHNITLGDTGMQTVLMEFLGYCISNDEPKADKILVLTGSGQNGKSRFLNVWKALGGRGVKSLSINDLDNPFHMQMLDGALFNIMEEVPAFSNKDTWEMMKNLATGGSISVSRKFKDPYSFQNKAKLIMTCNELPKGATQNHGYFRRLLIAEFKAKFSEELGNIDRDLDARIIRDEMSGVARIAVQMYHRLKKNNYKFSTSEAMKQSLADYKEDMDSVARWANDHVELSDGTEHQGNEPEWAKKDASGRPFVVVETMRIHYANWCKNNGEKAVSTRVFGARLEANLLSRCCPDNPNLSGQIEKSRIRVQGVRKKVIYGARCLIQEMY